MVVHTKMVVTNTGGEKWSEFGNVLRIHPVIFAYRL